MNESKIEERGHVSLQNELDGLRYMIGEYRLTNLFGGPSKISYAHFIFAYIESAIESLESHLQAIEQNTCNETLILDFKEATQKSYWLQDDRMREEMYALANKPICDYGLKIAFRDKEFADSPELYKAIDEGIEKLIALLKKVEEAQ